MNFSNEHMNVYILIGVGLLVLVYLLNYYIRSCIDSEIGPIKKKIKKLQSTVKQNEQNEQNGQNSGFKAQNQDQEGLIDDAKELEVDVDSYFDPTR
jgi:hypothetical protein